MYVVRDIFHLKFGMYKQAKTLMEEAENKKMFPESESRRMLSDFTGDSYRLILEVNYKTLADFETALNSGMAVPEWKDWYENFKACVVSSHREILKLVM